MLEPLQTVENIGPELRITDEFDIVVTTKSYPLIEEDTELCRYRINRVLGQIKEELVVIQSGSFGSAEIMKCTSHCAYDNPVVISVVSGEVAVAISREYSKDLEENTSRCISTFDMVVYRDSGSDVAVPRKFNFTVYNVGKEPATIVIYSYIHSKASYSNQFLGSPYLVCANGITPNECYAHPTCLTVVKREFPVIPLVLKQLEDLTEAKSNTSIFWYLDQLDSIKER